MHSIRVLIRSGLMPLTVAGVTACGGTANGSSPPIADEPVALQEVASGLSFPLYLTTAPQDPDRLFIVEKTGQIRIVRSGNLLATPFLDVSSQVSSGSEQGLLGMAFHPGYASNGRFFVNYTDTEGHTHVAEFRVSSDPDRADPQSERLILQVDQPYSNHNGGMVTFGPDGYLYIGMGDGGSGGDPQGHGQDRSELLGSLLRIDVNSGNPYGIPPDNPYVGNTAIRAELWDYGQRNPWRFSFDRENGDLYIADVGQNAREEVNVSPASSGAGKGANYGWNIMEGLQCFTSANCSQDGLVRPVLDYSHDGAACSVTGGYVYRGSAIPALRGVYFYGDFCAGWVRSFRYEDGQAADQRQWPALAPGGNITSFGEDAAGEIYILESGGRVFRVVPSG